VAERSAISQAVQIGVETTPGTLVACPKRLGSMGFSIGPSIDSKPLRPTGTKYPTLQILGKEWVEADINGLAVYTELPYAFASVMSTPTVAQIMDGGTPTGAYRWTFDSSTFNDDAPKTFTVEQGSSFRAHRFGGMIIPEYSWDWSREQIELGGSAYGKAIEDGVTLTSSPTMLPQIPVRPTDLSVYMDTTAAGLGGTKLTRTLKGQFSIADRFAPLWVVDAAQTSYAASVETEPTIEFKMTQMADAAAMASLTGMRTGVSKFLRLQATGPNIYTGSGGTPLIVNHQVTIDVAGQVSDVSSFDEEDGVFAVEWTYRAVHDGTWGKALKIEVITTTTAL
jgi:hypothetical protein